MFADRQEAGQRLAARLRPLAPAGTVVVALPRGGVPVAEVIATALGLPMDIVQVRKVGLPGQPELAVAAVTDGDAPAYAINRDVMRAAGLTAAAIRTLAARELDEIARRRALWAPGHSPVAVAGRTVLVVDDGIATGATMRAALDSLRAAGAARLIAAVPVAAQDALDRLSGAADQVVCLEVPHPFVAVGAHYRDFAQVSDAEVAAALARQAVAAAARPAPPADP